MKLGIVMPLWRREELTRLTLQRIAREVEGDKECILVAITDEETNGEQARECGFEVVSVPNVPLSDKKNAGIEYLEGRVDGVVLLGSDDWAIGLHGTRLLERYREALECHPFVGPLDTWYLNLRSLEGGYSEGYKTDRRRGEPTGVGRAIRAEVLEMVNWAPRPRGLGKNHDGAMCKLLKAAGVPRVGRSQEELGIRIVDIKSDTSVTPFDRLKLRDSSCGTVMMPFPGDEVDELLVLSHTLYGQSSGRV